MVLKERKLATVTGPSTQGRRKSSAPGIKDVAALAGVSWKTVTNVVHGRNNVRPETEEKVRAAIDALGYRPNLVGRQLASGRTGVIALSIPEITQPYFAGLAHAVIKESKRRGMIAIIDESMQDAKHELAALEGRLAQKVDGVIISTLALDDAQISQATLDPPVVLLGERGHSDIADHVGVDSITSSIAATEHLLDMGYRNLAFIGLDATGVGTGALRNQGFLRALEERGMNHNEQLTVISAEYSRESGYLAVDRLLTQGDPFDGLVCGSDMLAIGALRALHDHGISVPQEVGVIGWDGIPDGIFSIPSLSTIEPDTEALAQEALDILMARIEGHTEPSKYVNVQYRLLVRESSNRTNVLPTNTQ